MALRKVFSVGVIGFAAIHLAGCTTTENAGTIAPASFAPASAQTASFAPMPDLTSAPIPASKPVTPEAMASLAAQVESDTDAVMKAGSGQTTAAQQPVMTEMATPAVASANSQAMAIPASYAPQAMENPAALAAEAVASEPEIEAASAAPVQQAAFQGTGRDRECLMRAMYFESNRSSRDGQLAVGTVVMNRVANGNWGSSVCGVVGAKRQFAPGVMSRRMQGDTSDLAALADAILKGKRHPGLPDNAMYFHQAGLKFRYPNIRYVLTAGGNTFYYKARRRG